MILQVLRFVIIDVFLAIACLKASLEGEKASVDWFYGFKLYLAFNDCGEILNVTLTPENIDDKKPVRELLKDLQGKFVGEKGYSSKNLASDLRSEGIILLTKFKNKMNNRLVEWSDRLLIKKKSLN